LRMINVTDQPQIIYKNTFAAMAESIDPWPKYNQQISYENPTSWNLSFQSMERCRDNLTPDQHKRVLDLLMQNKDVFSQSKYDIGLRERLFNFGGGGWGYVFFLKKYSDSQCCWNKYSDFGGGKKSNLIRVFVI
jgi:hypothetical protein